LACSGISLSPSPTRRLPTTRTRPPAERTKPAPRKLSYRLQRELDSLPSGIEQLETRVGALRSTVSDPAFYQRPHSDVQQQLAELHDLEQQLERAVERWAELEQLANDVAGNSRSTEP